MNTTTVVWICVTIAALLLITITPLIEWGHDKHEASLGSDLR